MAKIFYAIPVLLLVFCLGCAGPPTSSGTVEVTAISKDTSKSATSKADGNKNPEATALKVENPKKTKWEFKKIEKGVFNGGDQWVWTITGKPAAIQWYGSGWGEETFVQFEDNEIVILTGHKAIAPGKTLVIKVTYQEETSPPHELRNAEDISITQ